MGHLVAEQETAYDHLQGRLDRLLTGAPDAPAFRSILRLLFSPEEAEVAAAIPRACPLEVLASRVGRDEAELGALITGMARRGLVFDLEHRGRRWVQLAPVVIGLYEFTFMRVREDAPMERLAQLFREYFRADPAVVPARGFFEGSVQIGRALVREEALDEAPASEVLDWERATAIVRDARSVGVSLCPCRTHARLLGEGCDAPVRTCLTLNAWADALCRAGIAERITNDEGLAILEEAKAAGLVQVADNVQRDVGYLCNCCGCCCGMLGAIRRLGMTHAVVSSSFVAATDREKCRGCKLCLRACPVDAITMIDTEGRGPRRYWSVVDPDRCLGCGVCFPVCRWGGRAMVPRRQRAYTAVTGLERDLAMALERGKLGDYLADTMEGQGPRGVAVALRILERLAPDDARRVIEPLGSAYLDAFTRSGAGPAVTEPDAVADPAIISAAFGPSSDRKHAPPRM